MATAAGIWLDHRGATVVAFTDRETSQVTTIPAGVEQKRRGANLSSSRPADVNESLTTKSKTAVNRGLKDYFAEIVAACGEADSLAIVGPGPVKSDLRRFLTRKKWGDRIVSFEAADRMSGPRLRNYFRDLFFPDVEPNRTRALTARDQKSLKHSKRPAGTRNAKETSPAAAPVSKKRATGPAAQTLLDEMPIVRAGIRRGTGRKNVYANMPKARKVR
jgi:hypothetical protein